MKRVIFAVLFALTIGRAGPAPAQSWTPIATGPDQSRFELDTSSIRTDGGYVSSWVRIIEPHDMQNPSDKKTYRTVTFQHLDDCAGQTFTTTETILSDSQNVVVSSIFTPKSQWQFISAPPGSVADAVEKKICSVASYRATLKPTVDLKVYRQIDWQSISYDAEHKITYSLAPASISAAPDDHYTFIAKIDANDTLKLTDGTPYKSAISTEVVHCKANQLMIMTADYYDVGGNLIETAKLRPTDALPMIDVAPGSTNALEVEFVCKHGAASAPASSEPRLESGTAWLGPGGYLVTADHVVAGATKLVVAQDGQPVGTADIVLEDAANDVAVLRPHLQTTGHAAIALSETPARLGEKVFTLGYPAPGDMGFSVKMTSGEVSATAGDDPQSGRLDDPRLMQISIPIQPGNSGGPVIDESGHAVGVVVARLEKAAPDQIAQNVNYALKIGYLRNLIADLPDIGTPRPVKAGSLVSIVAAARSGVFLILAESPPPSSQ